MPAAEALEYLDDLAVIRGEIRRAVVGEYRDLILRQQPFPDEPNRRLDAFRRVMVTPAAEEDEERAVLPGGSDGAGLVMTRGITGERVQRIDGSAATPFSSTVKSSRVKSVMGLPSRSSTRTSTGTSVTVLRKVPGTCDGCGCGCATTVSAATPIQPAATQKRLRTGIL
jgi:hypothetical protein